MQLSSLVKLAAMTLSLAAAFLLLLEDGWAFDDDAGGGVEAVAVAEGLLGQGEVLGQVVLVVALVFVLLEAFFFVLHVVKGARVSEFFGFLVLDVVGSA